jgi:uncharacterized repeat protein (TIGR03803 family)
MKPYSASAVSSPCFIRFAILLASASAWAQSYTTLATFSGPNGSSPKATLVQGTDGNFYGTTSAGGANNQGSIFKITPGGVLTTIYSFGSTAADGAMPLAGLIQGADGNFYGTASEGGMYGVGTVFKITPGGALTTLYSFSGATPDGATPEAALVQGTDGNFYGTTDNGGADSGGIIYRITPGGTLTTLYSNSFDDCGLISGLTLGTDGSFYGTTCAGGAKGDGMN